MKKLLIASAAGFAMSCGAASAGGIIFFPVPVPTPAPAPTGWTANATVSQSVGNIRHSYVQQNAEVAQNSPVFGAGVHGKISTPWSATATVNQSVAGAYGSRVYQNTSVIQNSPVWTGGAP